MAEAYDVALALHCPLGPIALAANLQLDAVCYNAFIQEQSSASTTTTTNDLLDYVKDRSVFEYRDGFVGIPQGPGLGIEVDEEVVERMAADRPPLAQSGVAARGRQLRRVVNGVATSVYVDTPALIIAYMTLAFFGNGVLAVIGALSSVQWGDYRTQALRPYRPEHARQGTFAAHCETLYAGQSWDNRSRSLDAGASSLLTLHYPSAGRFDK